MEQARRDEIAQIVKKAKEKDTRPRLTAELPPLRPLETDETKLKIVWSKRMVEEGKAQLAKK